jgi:hypothetical protein
MPNAPVDLAAFRPGSPGELLDGIVSHVAPLLGAHWAGAQAEIGEHLRRAADRAHSTQQRLLAGEIPLEEAQFLFNSQARYLRQVLRLAQFNVFVAAQAVVDAVFAVVGAAVRNVTGFDLAAPPP